MDDVLPSLIVEEGVEGPGGDKKSGEGARIYLANSGCQRFDIVSHLTCDSYNESG